MANRFGRPAGSAPADAPAGGEDGEALLALGRFFRKGEMSADSRALFQIGGREADSFYRDRWAHDKVVRSTHGVKTVSTTPPSFRGRVRGSEPSPTYTLRCPPTTYR